MVNFLFGHKWSLELSTYDHICLCTNDYGIDDQPDILSHVRSFSSRG